MAEQNHEILRVEHLKKFFTVPNGMLHAVDDISFTIEQGKTLGVVGACEISDIKYSAGQFYLLDKAGGADGWQSIF